MIRTNEDTDYSESEEILRHIKSLDINDPLRDELYEELEEARLNEDQDFVRELRKVMSK